ncbi:MULTISPECIES: Ger(x)C family spore germination protein [Paenibacillus]|uniref:Ger(X)C family spore germination protein n=1 Tax=Paenibacillus violae TaxID=3077234 RepID=A0ABU3RJ59_9BACL|nr:MULTISPECIES: Ger(x)C family spore germination protein [Paenibacillus]MDU0203877.1 Ger(x)C family spore germination protein [Paenibacillus sp. PFR10]MEC0271333.1 Ger(x)C family spore germination protein [Paenibacillus anseongense]
MRTKRRVVLTSLISFVICCLCTSCWDRTELNKIAITAATAVDWENDHWKVSYQVVIPQSISSTGGMAIQQAPVLVFSTNGDSIQSAVQRASLEMPRTMFFAHNRVVVIGESAARKGISPIIDVYLRSANSRETVSLLVSRDEGRKILEQILPLEKIPGAALRNMVLNEDKTDGNLKQVMLYQLAMRMASDSGYSTIPEVFISGKGIESTSIENLKSTNFDTKLKMGRIGVFQKDKLVGWMTGHEGYGLSWLKGEINQSTLFFGCSEKSEKSRSAIRITKASTKLTPVNIQGKWIIQAAVKASGQLLENGCVIDASKPEGSREMEKLIGETISELMSTSLRKAQSMKADVLGFAGLIHRKDPKAWEKLKPDWEEYFAQIQMESSFQIDIENIGMNSKSVKQLIEIDNR